MHVLFDLSCHRNTISVQWDYRLATCISRFKSQHCRSITFQHTSHVDILKLRSASRKYSKNQWMYQSDISHEILFFNGILTKLWNHQISYINPFESEHDNFVIAYVFIAVFSRTIRNSHDKDLKSETRELNTRSSRVNSIREKGNVCVNDMKRCTQAENDIENLIIKVDNDQTIET